MEKERVAILRSKLMAQQAEIRSIYGKIEDRKQKGDPAHLESLAYQLHNLYCAFEDLFKIVAEAFENQIEDKAQFHVELLKRMTLSIEGVRPALISKESFRALDNLRAFRHFFRHAYSYELDERKVRLVLDDVMALRKLNSEELDSFLGQL